MEKFDCLGEICPVPIMKMQSVINAIQNGEPYMLVTDHSCTLTSIEGFCKTHHFYWKTEEVMNGVWEITVSANKSSL